ncbi:MAG TPA: hypothetical protein VM469_13930 [Pseudoxanthomonas sp.]|jgi:hypothetical protein|nr:hypothetical protein [Pseudoxanthomonas sp.]
MDVNNRLGLAASCALLAAACMTLAAVVERVLAALWQWYKFSGYGGGGAISLSQSTAVVFLVLVGMMIGAAFWLRRQGARVGATLMSRLSTAALWVFCVAVVLYAVVALSPLNAWRPPSNY